MALTAAVIPGLFPELTGGEEKAPQVLAIGAATPALPGGGQWRPGDHTALLASSEKKMTYSSESWLTSGPTAWAQDTDPVASCLFIQNLKSQ